MNKYDPQTIEAKWQKYWEENQTFRVATDLAKEKFFGLVEFPYPSGAGLHVGHPRSYTAMDVITRQKRMEGKNVLYPIGFDSFGLPTENFAIKTGRPPAEITAENIANFTRQLKALGFGFDWSRAVTTSEPEYYKWTQWIFLQLYKHGLAYKTNQPINWCPKDKIGLANEEVVDGCCERCGNPVEKRNKEQWMLAITKYADKLLEGLNEVDYISRAKTQQENWIGRSEGAEINFSIKDSEQKIKVFTTRPDTIFGVTFLAVSAEWAEKWFADKEASKEIKEYIATTLQGRTTAVAREEVEKTGINSGIVAVNPVSGEEVPVWIVNYVLADVGTGAIMAVPAHDERDWEFASKYTELKKKDVVLPPVFIYSVPASITIKQIEAAQNELKEKKAKFFCFDQDTYEFKCSYKMENDVFLLDDEFFRLLGLEKPKAFAAAKPEINHPFLGDGFIFNSCSSTLDLNGFWSTEAKVKVIAYLEEKKIGNHKVQFKLRDWVFSRQRYWGEPIPLVHCDACADWIPLPESELPLELPKVAKYLPTDTGESPLAAMTDWVKTTCPKCGGEARRETDTMPNWAGSSWYFLRYMDPKNAKDLFTANGFKFRPAIEPTEKDKTYFATFKQVYQDLEKQNIKVWAGNRLLLNGLNRNLWTELRTVCLVAWNDDKAAIANYLLEQGYTLTQSFNQNDLYEKAGVRVEIVPVWKENGEMYSLTYQGAKQPMLARDLPEVLMGHLWGFSFRIISPEYNLAHYEYTEKHESDGQSNQEKIAFLSEWVEKINPNIRYWNQVDWYNGGMEHTVLHLLYSRFWNQFLYDIGVVPTLEPYKKRTSHGMILAKGGEKMSKSKGNVVNPDEMVELYGADALRTYIMFMGPFDQAVEWDTNGLVGVRRFLDKVWNLQEKVSDNAETSKKVVTQLHQTIKKVTDDIANMSFNTPVAKLMELVNAFSSEEQIAKTDYQILIKLVSVFAPHIGEELWSMFGVGGSVALATWPAYDAALAKDSEVTVAVQVNGKVRAELVVSPDIAEEEIKTMALTNETIQKWLEGKEPKKVIYVKGRLVSIVV